MAKVKVTFCSGAGTVTGANYLLEGPAGAGERFLVDCGLVQGSKMADDANWEPFSYDPASIDYLFITHAHIDHVGRIPKLFKDGFKGKIISTIPTHELAKIMIEDTINILGRSDENHLNEIYNENALRGIMALWQGVEYHKPFKIGGFTVNFRNAGHILGSAMIEFTYNGKKIVFTGDLGNSPSPLLPDCEEVTDADYLIMESVYGDRNHESRNLRRKMLEEVIEDNYRNERTLIIPTFSLERSQELLFEINNLVEEKRIPMMPIFFDSPLAIKLTAVYRKFDEYFNENARALIKSGDDIFTFPGLKITLETEESKYIVKTPDPKIVIAGSGMSTGGRILHHEKNYLPNPDNIILLTGYQSAGSIGRQIQDGMKTVRIAGEEVAVRAEVRLIEGYSGHKDSDALLNFAEKAAGSVKKIFAVMGEPKSALYFVQKIRDNLGLNAYVPEKGDVVELEC